MPFALNNYQLHTVVVGFPIQHCNSDSNSDFSLVVFICYIFLLSLEFNAKFITVTRFNPALVLSCL